jgi:hypothetical protein
MYIKIKFRIGASGRPKFEVGVKAYDKAISRKGTSERS